MARSCTEAVHTVFRKNIQPDKHSTFVEEHEDKLDAMHKPLGSEKAECLSVIDEEHLCL